MFNAAKDAMASRAAQNYANNVITRYGKVVDLSLDSKQKTIEAVCLLHGETEPITVKVGKYVIEEVGPKKFIKALHCTCSRPWAQSLLVDFIEGRRVELPSWAAMAL